MLNQHTILSINPDENAQMRTYKTLLHHGFNVIDALNGYQGLDYSLRLAPDIVLCHSDLPDMSGVQLLQSLRTNPKTQGLPVIMTSTSLKNGLIKAAHDFEASAVLRAPLDYVELMAAIYRVLMEQQAAQKQAEIDQLRNQLDPRHREWLERAKRRLSLLVAHELRTPLMTIIMSQDLIWMQSDDIVSQEVRDILTVMNSGTRRLKHLVDQMVLLTQVETGILQNATIQQNLTMTTIPDLLHQAVDLARQFSPQYAEGPVQIISDKPDPKAYCNVESMKHALAELINNGLRFSPANEHVEIHCQRLDQAVRISIIDRGVGIPVDQLSAALTAFEQIERETNEQQGLGMGLPLAYRIVEAHGGSLTIHPVHGGGTAAVVLLPDRAPYKSTR